MIGAMIEPDRSRPERPVAQRNRWNARTVEQMSLAAYDDKIIDVLQSGAMYSTVTLPTVRGEHRHMGQLLMDRLRWVAAHFP
jgi:hypothetical protein